MVNIPGTADEKAAAKALGKLFVKGNLADDAAVAAFRTSSLNAMKVALSGNDSVAAKGILDDIVAEVGKDVMTINARTYQNLLRRVADEGNFKTYLVQMSKQGGDTWKTMIKTIPDGTLKGVYKSLGTSGSDGALRSAISNAVEAGAKGPDFKLPTATVGDDLMAMNQTEFLDAMTRRLANQGVDATDDAAVGGWIKTTLGIGNKALAVSPFVVTGWILLDLAHGITGLSYMELLRTFFNPSRMFDMDDEGTPASCSTVKAASCSLTADDGTAYTTQTDCEDNDGVWDEGGEYTTKADCENSGGTWTAASDSGNLITTMGYVLIGLVGIVSVTFIMRLISMISGK